MTYRVTFIERTNAAGQASEAPPDWILRLWREDYPARLKCWSAFLE